MQYIKNLIIYVGIIIEWNLNKKHIIVKSNKSINHQKIIKFDKKEINHRQEFLFLFQFQDTY